MPFYAIDVGPGAIPLQASQAYAIRLQFMKNDTAPADAGVQMVWSRQPGHSAKAIPTAELTPSLPSPTQAMAALQRSQFAHTAGWGSWYPHNLLAVTRLPDSSSARSAYKGCQYELAI